MNKSRKIYIKALEKYNNGYIDKAIELCEESISIDIKNAAAINLKGLLCYLKGDLEEAQKLWKMNKQINKDGISEKYLEDTKKDKERLKFYGVALELIRELKIQEALVLLKKCLESDYNLINVNNHLALCYMKKGLYNKALEHVEKVLTLDRTNVIAKDTRKKLKSYGVLNKEYVPKKLALILIGVICLVVLLLGTIVFINFSKDGYKSGLRTLLNFKVNSSSESHKKETGTTNKEIVKEKKSGAAKPEIKEDKKSNVQNEVFPYDKIKGDIESKNFDAVYDENIKWRDKNISDTEKTLLSSANELLKTEGVEYFYDKAYSYMNSEDYVNAKVYFTRCYELGGQHYLYPHIVYMLGTTFHLSGDAENTIKYYSEYDKAFSGGEYEETVLYTLALIYKDKDAATAKVYAEKLLQNYPQSIYNNSVINSLIY
ncbi:hypothetical protein P8V03_03010 [Clostridium sp. A1-XYC3]|uniref:Tetratricopeptide repeat protein n=1 Tax=Clostridium tanneri TaxID=3037988 RepID=A0ABU4JQ90_9CLOT|nr:tetratricopeptide repeat protein [Clostridium sp. A1-XYC3]MDW8800121.1 hypothetical protein [Clostridium sp. A1-XYC3]